MMRFACFICGQIEDCESCKEIDKIAEQTKNRPQTSQGRPKISEGARLKRKSKARVAATTKTGSNDFKTGLTK